MSSMRNAVARRPHRERAQPHERRRLGLLEKHKDYSARAKDYNTKKATLKSLRQKAADRNEDEFYFGMLSRKGPGNRLKDGKNWTGTVQGDRGNKAMDMDVVRLLKTQDVGYVRMMRQVIGKEVKELEEKIVLTRGFDALDEVDDDDDDGNEDEEDDDEEENKKVGKRRRSGPLRAPSRKIIFAESQEERNALLLTHQNSHLPESTFSFSSSADRPPSNPSPPNSAPTTGGTEEQRQLKAALKREKNVRTAQRQLELSRKKLDVLVRAEQALDEQRARMAKTKTSIGRDRKGGKAVVHTRKR